MKIVEYGVLMDLLSSNKFYKINDSIKRKLIEDMDSCIQNGMSCEEFRNTRVELLED